MKFSKFASLLTVIALTTPALLLFGCANPYDKDACEGGRYHPPHYGTYPNSSYYDNDYYKDFERDNGGLADHRYDHTYGPNQVYIPSDKP